MSRCLLKVKKKSKLRLWQYKGRTKEKKERCRKTNKNNRKNKKNLHNCGIVSIQFILFSFIKENVQKTLENVIVRELSKSTV